MWSLQQQHEYRIANPPTYPSLSNEDDEEDVIPRYGLGNEDDEEDAIPRYGLGNGDDEEDVWVYR